MDHTKPYPDGYIDDIFASVRTIAVVGASPKPHRPSHEVMAFLIEAGYDVFPVNPKAGVDEILGRPVFAALADIGVEVDMVDVFRESSALMGIAREAVDIRARVLWGQLGVADPKAAALAEEGGLQVVMNRCPKIELKRNPH